MCLSSGWKNERKVSEGCLKKRHNGFNYDVFAYAIRNVQGNYVLLGSRQLDTETNEISTDYTNRDLILVELDASLGP